VLLASADGQSVALVALVIYADADDTSRHLSLEVVLGGEVSSVRAAIAHWQAESLGGTEGDIGTHFPGGLDEGEGHQVGGDSHIGAGGLDLVDELGVVVDAAEVVGVLQKHTADVLVPRKVVLLQILHLHVHSDGLRSRPQNGQGLREDVLRDYEGPLSTVVESVAHVHGLGGGGGLVEERGVGDVHLGELHDHGLVVQERLQSSLRYFRLVRSVACVPHRVLQHIPQHHVRHVGGVVPAADIGLVDLVLLGDFAQTGQRERLGLGRGQGPAGGRVFQVSLVHEDGSGDGLLHELLDAGKAHGLEHLAGLLFAGAQMTGKHQVGRLEHVGDFRVSFELFRFHTQLLDAREERRWEVPQDCYLSPGYGSCT